MKEKFNFELDNLVRNCNIPYINPLTDKQYNYAKSVWSINKLITNESKLVYNHSKIEEEELFNIAKSLQELNIKENICSLIYDPIQKVIIDKSQDDDPSEINPINHSIIKLIYSYSKKLNAISKNIKKEKLLQTDDNFSSHCDLIDENQYYLENFYIFTLKEPCFMCAMALVHSRIERVYFLKENLYDGAFISKLKINNYNLNHSYLIFQILE